MNGPCIHLYKRKYFEHIVSITLTIQFFLTKKLELYYVKIEEIVFYSINILS